MQPYYDGVAVGRPRNWPAYRGLKDVPVPPTNADAFSILDFEKWIVILTGTGATPITVRYVKIWRFGDDHYQTEITSCLNVSKCVVLCKPPADFAGKWGVLVVNGR